MTHAQALRLKPDDKIAYVRDGHVHLEGTVMEVTERGGVKMWVSRDNVGGQGFDVWVPFFWAERQ